MLVVQADAFNRSLINTVLVAAVTSNLSLANAPGNIRLSRRQSGLAKSSVVNVSQVLTIDRRYLTERIGKIAPSKLNQVDAGLRLVLAL